MPNEQFTAQRTTTGQQMMTELCRSFHCLRDAPGIDPWDQKKFAWWASEGKSSAERQAAAFVLSVWNGGNNPNGDWWNEGQYRVGVFDAVTAIGLWDRQHRQAFLAWCSKPFWP